jgi:hypothetical protein
MGCREDLLEHVLFTRIKKLWKKKKKEKSNKQQTTRYIIPPKLKDGF